MAFASYFCATIAMLREINALIWKEVVLEWRQRYAFNGLLLYIGSTIFIAYLSFQTYNQSLSSATWNVLFWIIILFAAVNAIAKSFIQESSGRQLYYYTLARPESIIISKVIYNAALLLVIALLGFLLYSLVLGNPVEQLSLFILGIVLGSIAFSSSLTLISGIASKTANSSTIMAILAFPVLVPVMLMNIRISWNAISGIPISDSTTAIYGLVAINLIMIAMSFLLFPYLWRS
ncbi:heme exporter protein CcmB [Fulvivirgaceae bacterium LMO-SS25]